MEMDILICFGSVREKCKKLGIVYIQKQPSRGVLIKRCSENMQQIYIREHPCRSVISIKLKSKIIEITLRHGWSPVDLLYIFRTSFPKNTSGGLLFYLRRVFRRFEKLSNKFPEIFLEILA